ncbi:MAG: nuclear transport factor 2 family protein [Acidimicrobiales bacterium]
MEHDVSWLIDRAEIRELTARYGRLFDDGDAEEFAKTFTEDGRMEVVGGPTSVGREGLTDMCKHTPWGTMHVTVDATVEVEEDKAIQVVTILVVSRPATQKETPKLVGTGRYVDDLVRTPDGWRFSRRRVTLDGWQPK